VPVGEPVFSDNDSIRKNINVQISDTLIWLYFSGDWPGFLGWLQNSVDGNRALAQPMFVAEKGMK
jgi:hypothetical protein